MYNVSKNQPCPCGSGKKYKRCCELLYSKKKSPSVKVDFNVNSFFKEYNFKELIEWLQTVICHPINEIFLARTEFLIAQLFEVPASEFKGKQVTRETIITLFEKTNTVYDELFKSNEDFSGFPQEKLIPLFFDDEKFYFFQGGLERPHEFYLALIDRYFSHSLGGKFRFDEIKKLFTASLRFQTQLLKSLYPLKESPLHEGRPYIPSAEFYNLVKSELSELNIDLQLKKEYAISVGDYRNEKEQTLYEKALSVNLFNKKLFIKISNDYMWLYPHAHLKSFFDILLNHVQINNCIEVLEPGFNKRIEEVCDNAFTIYNTIISISSNSKPINSPIEHSVFTDNNKLLLFKSVNHSYTSDISIELTIAHETACKFVSKLLECESISIETTTEARTIESVQLDIFIVLVIDPLTFSMRGSVTESKWNYSQVYCLTLMDLTAIVNELQTGIEIIKYFKEETRIKYNSKFMIGEYIEQLAFYVQNGNSFLRSAKNFDSYIFSPHMWHDYYHDKIYAQLIEEDIFLEVHKKCKNYYNKISKLDNGAFRLTKTGGTHGAFLLSLRFTYLWIIMPPQIQLLSEIEFMMSYDLVGALFKEYLKKEEDRFLAFLSELYFSVMRMSIIILPESRITEGSISFLSNAYKKQPEGFQVMSFYNKVENEIDTFFIFEPELLADQFSKQQNYGERISLHKYLESLCVLAGMNNSDASIRAAEHTDILLPVGAKRYAAALLDVENPKLQLYDHPCKFIDSDFAIANRLISGFLITSSILPGKYGKNDALRICSSMYKMLLCEIEVCLNKFNTSAILFAYKELELGEGEKYKAKLRLEMKAGTNFDYDLTKHFTEEDRSLTTLTMTQRFLLQIAIKVNPSGREIFSKERWSHLLALGKIAIDISVYYENLVHNLHEGTITITDDHLLEMDSKQTHFDNDRYYERDIEMTMNYYLQGDSEESEYQNPRKTAFKKHQEELNAAFTNDFGFTYNDLICVLYILKSAEFTNGDFFPVVECSIEDIIKMIQFMDTEHMHKEYIERIIKFLSIKEGSYADDHMFLQSRMMKHKERILVSPLVELLNGNVLYGSQNVYNALLNWSTLNKGVFLFTLPKNSETEKAIKVIHKTADTILEQQVFDEIKKVIPLNDIEFRVSNFNRLSKLFVKKPDCGEIDILCINRNTKIIFVVEVKNVTKRANNYHIKNNIQEFYLSESSYHKKLLKKKNFISQNMSEVLIHFSITEFDSWKVKEVFVTHDLQFAAFFNKKEKVDFILTSEINSFLIKNHFIASQNL